jgi:hypothetical protein
MPEMLSEQSRATVARQLSGGSLIPVSFRSVRPSLLDPRFIGDPWVHFGCDGLAALCLGDYRLVGIAASPLDLPTMNRVLNQMRHRCPRGRGLRRKLGAA